MPPEKLLDLLFSLLGLLAAIRFKYVGKSAIEQQKKLNKIFPTHSAKDFDEFAVVMTQITFLIAGIVVFMIGSIKLFS